MKHDVITENRVQTIIAAVPGGKWIIYRYGLLFRVFLDCPEGVAEFGQGWIARHRTQLYQICLAASEKTRAHGLEVTAYDRA